MLRNGSGGVLRAGEVVAAGAERGAAADAPAEPLSLCRLSAGALASLRRSNGIIVHGCEDRWLRWLTTRPVSAGSRPGTASGGLCHLSARASRHGRVTTPCEGCVHLYSPEGAPEAAAMPDRTAKPRWTRLRLALVALVDRYSARTMTGDASLVEIQKLMYFLQEAGEPLKLEFVRGRYGPYADNLRHALKDVEGHFLIGYGDGSAKVSEAEPLRSVPDAAHEALSRVVGTPIGGRIEDVLGLVSGFESSYDLELLATVHWIAEHEGVGDDIEGIVAFVRGWSARKRGTFSNRHIRAAQQHLRDRGWLTRAA